MIIAGPGGRQMALQMAYFDRAREPVVMEFGPVLDLQDVAGGKVCALASRAYERDFVDTAALLTRYAPEELISFACRLDPGLEEQDFVEAAQRLDQLPDRAFAALGLRREDVAVLRERFASWPRQAQARRDERAAGVFDSTDRQAPGANSQKPASHYGTAQARTDFGLEHPEPEAEM